MTLPIKTVMSVLEVTTYIITIITTLPVEIIAIMFVLIFITAVILYFPSIS